MGFQKYNFDTERGKLQGIESRETLLTNSHALSIRGSHTIIVKATEIFS